mmetsp:Transcript_74798/g.132307  ORF Transcript_74798/g.132307 Transcript_74798/m.132307 type:complete len:168 (-) Transcript_74798:38-541(-)
MLSILNIITAVFVDEALAATQKQKDLLIQQEQEMKSDYLKQVQHFFESVDADGSGYVTLSELVGMVEDPALSAYFSVLGFEIDDAKRLFMMLDADGSGEVEIGEFLTRCLKLKGEARSIDVHEIIYECRQLKRLNQELFAKMYPEAKRKLSLTTQLEDMAVSSLAKV